jgi:hypothetical protein
VAFCKVFGKNHLLFESHFWSPQSEAEGMGKKNSPFFVIWEGKIQKTAKVPHATKTIMSG